MKALSLEEIRRCFSKSSDFNEIFDAFQSAISQNLQDLEHYRPLFWNHSLSPDEIRLFGDKLAEVFPDVSYDVYLWLASVFEVTSSSDDNYELALAYYQKAAGTRPEKAEPYLDACDCYDPDLNIPPAMSLIDFIAKGTQFVGDPAPLHKRLSYLYECMGNRAQSEHFRRKAEGGGPDTGSE